MAKITATCAECDGHGGDPAYAEFHEPCSVCNGTGTLPILVDQRLISALSPLMEVEAATLRLKSTGLSVVTTTGVPSKYEDERKRAAPEGWSFGPAPEFDDGTNQGELE